MRWCNAPRRLRARLRRTSSLSPSWVRARLCARRRLSEHVYAHACAALGAYGNIARGACIHPTVTRTRVLRLQSSTPAPALRDTRCGNDRRRRMEGSAGGPRSGCAACLSRSVGVSSIFVLFPPLFLAPVPIPTSCLCVHVAGMHPYNIQCRIITCVCEQASRPA